MDSVHEVRQGQRYRHYKGRQYVILAIARHSETEEWMVVYEGLYDSDEFGPHPIWVRPLSIFTDTVTIQGKLIPRFLLLPQAEES